MGVALRHGRLVRIVCLVTGHVRAKAGQRGVRRYVVDEWRDEAMPVNAFLVEFTDGSRCLFDTGQTARAAAPRWFPFWHPFFRLSRFELTPADEIASQLRSIGVEPGSVGTVVLSHLHTDHVGGIDAFHACPGDRAPVGMGAGDGYRRAACAATCPSDGPTGLQPTLVDFDGEAIGPFPASYDVAGDGRLLLVPTPGHTPDTLRCSSAIGNSPGCWQVIWRTRQPSSRSRRRRQRRGAKRSGSRCSPPTIPRPRRLSSRATLPATSEAPTRVGASGSTHRRRRHRRPNATRNSEAGRCVRCCSCRASSSRRGHSTSPTC